MSRTVARLLIALAVALVLPIQGLADACAGVAAAAQHDGHSHSDEVDEGGFSADPHCCCSAGEIAPALTLSHPKASPPAALAATQHLVPGDLPDSFDRPPLVL